MMNSTVLVMSKSRKIVLIGDLIGSRKLSEAERVESQESLEECVQRINKRTASLLSPATITLGDEFQAVYSNMKGLLSNCWEIVTGLHPIEVRFSIAIGNIVTPINQKQALGMDGPAFHCARNGMDQLKETDRRFILTIHEDSVSDTQDRDVILLADGILQLMSVKMQQWRRTRYQILLMLNENIPVKEISARLSISETAVYKNINEGHLEMVLDQEKRIATAVGRLL